MSKIKKPGSIWQYSTSHRLADKDKQHGNPHIYWEKWGGGTDR